MEWPNFLELSSPYKEYRYTLDFCQYLCSQKTLAEKCGCTDSFDWEFSSNRETRERAKTDCDAWNNTLYECMVSTYIDFHRGNLSCDCPNSCSDTSFKSLTSTATWPSAAYTPHFMSLMKNSKSTKVKKVLTDIFAESLINQSPQNVMQEKIKQNFAHLEINWETLVHQKVEEVPKYNLWTLFGTVGGNLGLWLGWSILSILEFLQWVSKTSVFLVMKLKKRIFERYLSHQEKPYL